MSCNVLQKRCKPASSVQILGDRLFHHCNKKKIELSPLERRWLKAWAMVASAKLGKTFVETVHISTLIKTAQAHILGK